MKPIRTAKGRKVSSTRWLERQLNDPYVRRAKAENYRSRAAYKLLELDERFGLLRGVKSVVDLGIAPGGWSQVVRRRSPQAQVVGIDLLPTEPLDGVTILRMDFMDEDAPEKLREALGGAADLVLSDMAANTVGHPQTDHLRTMALVEAGLEFAREVLLPGGAYVAKVLAGGADNDLVAELKRSFTAVKHAKPPASRKDSKRVVRGRSGLQRRGSVDSPAFSGGISDQAAIGGELGSGRTVRRCNVVAEANPQRRRVRLVRMVEVPAIVAAEDQGEFLVVG